MLPTIEMFGYVKGEGIYFKFPSKALSNFIKEHKSIAQSLPSLAKRPTEYTDSSGKTVAYQFQVPEKEINLWRRVLKPFFTISFIE